MESEALKELPNNGEVVPSFPEVLIGFRVDFCAFGVLITHLVESVIFLWLCWTVAYDLGQFKDDQLFSTLDKLRLGVGVVAAAHVVFSLVLFHLAKKRCVSLFRGCVCAKWALSAAALLYVYVVFSAQAPWTFYWFTIFAVIRRLAVFGWWVYATVCLYRWSKLLKGGEVLEKLNEELKAPA